MSMLSALTKIRFDVPIQLRVGVGVPPPVIPAPAVTLVTVPVLVVQPRLLMYKLRLVLESNAFREAVPSTTTM